MQSFDEHSEFKRKHPMMWAEPGKKPIRVLYKKRVNRFMRPFLIYVYIDCCDEHRGNVTIADLRNCSPIEGVKDNG